MFPVLLFTDTINYAAKLAFLPPQSSYSFSSVGSTNGTVNSSNLTTLNLNLNSNETTNTGNNLFENHSVPAPPISANENYIEAKLNLTTRAEWQYTPRDLNKIEVCWSRTSKNNRIACMYGKYILKFRIGL